MTTAMRSLSCGDCICWVINQSSTTRVLVAEGIGGLLISIEQAYSGSLVVITCVHKVKCLRVNPPFAASSAHI
jgi:hypothetical protein